MRRSVAERSIQLSYECIGVITFYIIDILPLFVKQLGSSTLLSVIKIYTQNENTMLSIIFDFD